MWEHVLKNAELLGQQLQPRVVRRSRCKGSVLKGHVLGSCVKGNHYTQEKY